MPQWVAGSTDNRRQQPAIQTSIRGSAGRQHVAYGASLPIGAAPCQGLPRLEAPRVVIRPRHRSR